MVCEKELLELWGKYLYLIEMLALPGLFYCLVRSAPKFASFLSDIKVNTIIFS